MNYLSHYFADSRPGAPYYNFGLALPDMLGVISRRWKANRKDIPYSSAQDKEIWMGIARHLKADAHFHHSEFFKEQTHYLRRLFEEHHLIDSGIRLFFLAHISLELLLDRLLLKDYPLVAIHFYKDLDQIDDTILCQALDESVIAVNTESFLKFFYRFKQSRYLYRYLDNDGLLFSIGRILERAGQGNRIGLYEKPLLEALLQAEDTLPMEDFLRSLQHK